MLSQDFQGVWLGLLLRVSLGNGDHLGIFYLVTSTLCNSSSLYSDIMQWSPVNLGTDSTYIANVKDNNYY